MLLLDVFVGAACTGDGPTPTRAAKRFEGQTVPPSSLFLHGGPATDNPATLWLDLTPPSATNARYRDSSGVNFNNGNPWKVIGTWNSSNGIIGGSLAGVSDLHVWLGLKNSDDIGTQFDLRAEVIKNGTAVTDGEARCVTSITRNPSLAKEVTVSLGAFAPVLFDGSTDVLSLRLSTRIGTTAAGAKCSGPGGSHNNAVGLRLYFDADTRNSRVAVTMVPTCTAAACDDHNPCTVDECSASGVCTHTAAAAGTSCINGTACNGTGVCDGAGGCQLGAPVVCTASDQCHQAGICNPWTGVCTNPMKPDGSPCNDGNACTQTDSCVAGSCVGSNPMTCPADPNCLTPGTCDPGSGQCSAPSGCRVCGNGNTEPGEECDDGNTLSGDGCSSMCKNEFCGDGILDRTVRVLKFKWLGRSCGVTPVADIVFSMNDHEVARLALPSSCDCQPGTQTVAVTDPALLALGTNGQNTFRVQTGGELAWAVVHVETPIMATEMMLWGEGGWNGSGDLCAAGSQASVDQTNDLWLDGGEECDDGNTNNDDACSNDCESNRCHGVSCQAQDQCHLPGTCDPQTGQCTKPPKGDGTTCDDGNACTTGDACVAGVCTGTSPIVCPIGDKCNDWACEAAAGGCIKTTKPDGTACSDDNACTAGDTCQAGACAAGAPVACVAQDQCHDAGLCDPTSGTCSNPSKADNTACDDGNPSTNNDMCRAGTCAPNTSACTTVQSMDAGNYSTCVIWTGGELWCWGYNSSGQLGIGSTSTKTTPTQLAFGGWAIINVGSFHACGIQADSTLWCWGANSSGQLGIGPSGNQTTPVEVGNTGWTQVSLGSGHTCATTASGRLWCWGGNSYGQLGIGSTANRSIPSQVSGTTWRSVATGSWHTCATKSDGTLWCWGLNNAGQLGIGTSDYSKPTPSQVDGSNWDSVSAGYQHTCATKTDGTLWCWGYNPYGQLGDGTTSGRSRPQQVAGSGWADVSAGYGHTCARRTDRTLWCWGYNQSGEVGDGTTAMRPNPTQLPGADWTGVSVGSGFTCATRFGTSLSCWGNNGYGQLGDGSTVGKPTPTQIGRGGCAGVCGDGYLDWGEQCDDGNTLPGDGCSPHCGLGNCGDGVLGLGEDCDDGNTISGDGCSAGCLREFCGNGRVDFGEECDDGNTVNDDACSNTCKLNRCYGVSCAGIQQPCQVMACNPANGQCEGTPQPDGTPCDDADVCTQTDSCHGGQCVGSNPLDCSAKNGCQLDGSCNPAKGCVNPSRPDGTTCDDGRPATIADACEKGTCIGIVSAASFQSQVTPISPTVPTSVGSSTAFLYTGPDAVQTQVATGSIDSVLAGVVRGLVKTRDGSPIAGVKITITGHPEWGQTRSREDGWFDMAVNGGGRLHINYERSGYLPVGRDVDVAWQDYSVVPDVVLTALDAQVTTVDLPGAAFQVARGSVITDEDGTRQAAVFFPPNVTATMSGLAVNAPLSRLSVRATEYTVGPTGPAAMPAPLPSNSGYTYAVELSADEAIAADALSVIFSKPVYLYVNNFLNLPVGASAPLGTYDRLTNWQNALEAWSPAPSGRVVKILQILGGRAVLAVDGTGLPAAPAALSALGITDDELATLAASYVEGQTLWRIPILHFSPQDMNLPYGYPHAMEHPHPGSPEQEPCEPCSQLASGSIIECENQVLGQRIPVNGTPFTLEYRSRQTAGDKRPTSLSLAAAPLSPGAQSLLKEVVVKTRIAGQEIEQQYDATTYPGSNPRFDFSWNGQDAYGRNVQGAQKAQVTLGYVYPILYRSQADLDIIFGEWAAPPASIVSRSAATATLLADASNTAGRQGAPQSTLGGLRAPLGELGGWSLSVHHAYDPQRRTLYLGDGSFQTADDVKQVISKLAGNGSSVTSGQFVSGPAGKVPVEFLPYESTLVVTPTGDVVFVDSNGAGKVDRTGMLTRFGYEHMYAVHLSAGYDGAVFFTEDFGRNLREVLEVTPPYDANAFQMAQAVMSIPSDDAVISAIAPSPDGVVYVVPGPSNCRILKRTPDGEVRQVAGTSGSGYSPDGTPAVEASLTILDIAAGPDGSLYVSEGARIRRIGPDGILSTVAGTGVSGLTGDGGPATAAQISATSLRVGTDGTIYLGNSYQGNTTSIRRIGADGVISTLVGNGQSGTVTEGASARAPLNISTFAIAPDGSLVFVENQSPSSYIWRVSSPLPGYDVTQTVLASKDGSELFVFGADGHHLRTDDALTGVTKYRFDYTPDGLLSLVTDRSGLATSIERSQAGQPTAIVAPNGQRTVLGLDANDYLASIADPAGNTYAFTYKAGGLMDTLVDPRQNLHTFEYDEMGRLKKDADPAGGFTALARAGSARDYTVAKTTAESRTTSYHVESFVDGSSRTRTTDPAGLTDSRATDPSGNTTWTTPAGMNGSVTIGPDPRQGMQAPLAKSTVTRTPSGSQMTVNMSRVVTQDANNALVSQVDTTTVNSKAFTSTYNAAARTVTSVSPVGRQTVTTLDTQNRVVQVQAGNLAPTAHAYDSRGRLATVTVGTGASARVATFGYDGLDRLATVTDPLNRTQSYGYDDANRVTMQTFADGNTVTFGYDANGNVNSVTPPGRPAHVFGFTPNDLMSGYTPPVLSTEASTTYEYNLDKQPTFVHRPDGRQIAFGYDNAGRLSTVTYPKGPNVSDGTVTVTRSYSPTTGRLASLSTSDGQTIMYGYDGSLLLSTTWSGAVAGSVSRTYNNDFRVASESVNGTNNILFGYDNDGLLTSAGGISVVRDPTNGLVSNATVGAVNSTNKYTSFGELKDVTVSQGSTSLFEENIPDNGVGRDSLGRIQQKTETIQGVSHTYNYSYDSAGRLWQVLQDGTLTVTYTYDANGNRIGGPGLTATPVYDTQDRLLSYGKWTYVYTANGELQSKTDTSNEQVTRYSYDAVGNLRNIALPDGRTVDYVIDSLNRRVAKKVNGSVVRKWIYSNGLTPAAEFDGSGNLVSRFKGTDYLVQGSTTFRVIKDHLGSPRLIVNATSGAVAQRLDYDEWGNVTISGTQPVDWQPYGFAGGLYDPDTGLVRFGARDYDPETGRWTAKDPIRFRARDSNLYRYVMGDPVNHRDPSGLDEPGAGVADGNVDAGLPETPAPPSTSTTFQCDAQCTIGVCRARQYLDRFGGNADAAFTQANADRKSETAVIPTVDPTLRNAEHYLFANQQVGSGTTSGVAMDTATVLWSAMKATFIWFFPSTVPDLDEMRAGWTGAAEASGVFPCKCP